MIKLFVLVLIFFCGPIFTIELIVVRHGQTDWNLNKRIQGWTDTELNCTGIQQATEAGKKLEKDVFDIVFSSDLKRAKETACYIVKQLEIPPRLGFFVDCRLREIRDGALEGMHITGAEKRAILKNRQNIPGAETKQEFKGRILSFLHYLNKNFCNTDRILIVTHGGVIRFLLREAGIKGRLKVPNASIFRFWLTPEGRLESLESTPAPLQET